MSIFIYTTSARKKEEFLPIKKGKVSMYVCGPTVYDVPHIGHARSAYIFDVIRRYLEYKGYDVKFVRNVTDVDDKIINKAKEEFPGEDLNSAVKKVSAKYLKTYHDDMKALGIRPPAEEPKATEYIPKMVKFIQLLVKNGCAYETDGDVYFDIKKAKDYGKLSGQNLQNLEAGVRIAPGENKKDPLDFALWKKAKPEEPSWKSPWGLGRPGWHIECSVMSSDILGDEFDIHGGGIDLVFPHHENEIAQSGGAGYRFARYWLHNGLLTINGEKMAKSLGNFITIKDFIDKYADPDYLKLFFVSAHYRSPIDYTEAKIEEAKKEKERFLILFKKIENKAKADQKIKKELETYRQRFEKAMDDDFNTPAALSVLFDLVTYANKHYAGKEVERLLTDLASIFGLELSKEVSFAEISEKEVLEFLKERDAARKGDDFQIADEIRKRLSRKGIILEDTKEGTTWRRKI